MKGKKIDYPRPLLEAIRMSKYQVKKIKNAQSANKIKEEVKSEYLSYIPVPNGNLALTLLE